MQKIELYVPIHKIYTKLIENYKMKDSAWIYVKDQMTLSVLFIMEIGLIPFHELNQAYYRAKQKMDIDD